MRSDHRKATLVGTRILVALMLAIAAALFVSVREGRSSVAVTQASPKLEATIFSYDGTDFVRTQTTLMTEEGKSAVNTKLDHGGPAYQALVQKRSYTGDATVFGKQYQANYAPLTDESGRVTGALFVAVPK